MFFWHRTLALRLPSRVSRSLGEYPNKTSIVFKTRWGANEPLCPLVLRAIFNETLSVDGANACARGTPGTLNPSKNRV